VTSGDRADLIVVWATLDRSVGRGAIKSFVVERDNPGLKLDRLEHKLGIRASDTANFVLDNCRVPKENLLGSPEIATAREGFAGVMQTFDNTRPMIAGMAVGVARAALDRTRELLAEAGVEISYDHPLAAQSAAVAEFLRLEADWEAGRLLALKAAWMADNRMPNTVAASIAKAKAARVATDVTLSCVALCGTLGYGEDELLEKWARDAKILDIFEGTQQIQQLVIARQAARQDLIRAEVVTRRRTRSRPAQAGRSAAARARVPASIVPHPVQAGPRRTRARARTPRASWRSRRSPGRRRAPL